MTDQPAALGFVPDVAGAPLPAPARGRQRRPIDRGVAIALMLAITFVVIGILFPLVAMIGTSLSADALPIFVRYLTPPQSQILVNTVILGVVVATVAPISWAFAVRDQSIHICAACFSGAFAMSAAPPIS